MYIQTAISLSALVVYIVFPDLLEAVTYSAGLLHCVYMSLNTATHM